MNLPRIYNLFHSLVLEESVKVSNGRSFNARTTNIYALYKLMTINLNVQFSIHLNKMIVNTVHLSRQWRIFHSNNYIIYVHI